MDPITSYDSYGPYDMVLLCHMIRAIYVMLYYKA